MGNTCKKMPIFKQDSQKRPELNHCVTSALNNNENDPIILAGYCHFHYNVLTNTSLLMFVQ